jgi:UDP-2,4-diacetamido-2,4,6-trideoxy-beta-L-altropyranose hydrolase
MWQSLRTLLFRVDNAGPAPDHRFLRCLALAQTWVDTGGRAVFVTAQNRPIIDARLTAETIECLHIEAQPGDADDARHTAKLAEQWEADWVVLDGGEFDAGYQQRLKGDGLRVLLLDEGHQADRYIADWLLNDALDADDKLYEGRADGTRLFLGPRYALLRREFSRWSNWRRTVPKVAKNLLVKLPWPAYREATIQLVDCLAKCGIANLEAVLIVPSSGIRDAALHAAVGEMPGRIRMRPNITAMPGLVAWADAAITAAGPPPYEWLLLGLPSLFLLAADDERPAAERFTAMQLGVILGNAQALGTPGAAKRLKSILTAWEDLETIGSAARQVVDGEGADRVCMWLCGDPVRLRRAKAGDCQLLWQWANDHEARDNSFAQAPISWDAHVRWFTDKLYDPRSTLFIGVDQNDTPMGRIRFDTTGRTAQVSLTIDSQYRGKGLAIALIERGVGYMFRHTWVEEIHAIIKPANVRSIKVFEKAGFKKVGLRQIWDQKALHYVLSRNRASRVGKYRIVPK